MRNLPAMSETGGPELRAIETSWIFLVWNAIIACRKENRAEKPL
jgi:hypothetical protein